MTIKTFDWQAQVDAARQKLLDDGFRLPMKPSTKINDIQLPDDISDIGDVRLADITMRFNAWYAYASTSTSFLKAEYSALDEVFEVNMGERVFALGNTIEGKTPAKDVLRGEVVINDQDMSALFHNRIQLSQRIQTLDGLSKGLEIQVEALRDEGIRRASVRKLHS